MKCLFVYTDIGTRNHYHLQHGIASISAVLKKGGHETALLYLQEDPTDDELLAMVKEHDPDVVAFSTGTHQWQFARKFSTAIKRSTDILTVCGGHHAVIATDEVVAHPDMDIVCRGEGEFPMLDLLDALRDGKDYTAIPSLVVKHNGKTYVNEIRNLIEPLDDLPFEDREIFDHLPLMEQTNYQPTLFCSRGCPFNCSYCCNNALMRIYKDKGKFVRQRSPENVIEELRALVEKYPVKSFYFEDDTFTLYHDWVKDFCARYSKEFDYPFRIYIRIETVNREILTLLKETGCRMVNIGLESGNEDIRRKVMNRKMTNEQIIEVFRMCDELGIETYNFNLIGVPGDTVDTIEDTMNLNRIVKPNHAQVSIFNPYPGTKLSQECIDNGYWDSDEEHVSFFEGSPLNLPTITKDEIFDCFKRFETLSFEIQAQKEAQGYYDFLAMHSEARVSEAYPGQVRIVDQLVGYENRLSVFAHPKSKISHKIFVKPDSVFHLGYGISPEVWDKCVPVIFKVLVKKGFRSHEIFSARIDPQSNPDDRRWHDAKIDLAEYGDSKITLTLVTETETKNNAYAWAVWSQPFIAGAEQSDDISRDAC